MKVGGRRSWDCGSWLRLGLENFQFLNNVCACIYQRSVFNFFLVNVQCETLYKTVMEKINLL